MKRRRWLYLIPILILGIALYMYGPSQEPPKKVSFENREELVGAVQEQLAKVKNYKYETKAAVGDQIKVAVLNRVDRGEEKRQMVDFSWDIPNMSGSTVMYAEGDRIFVFHPLKDKWMLPSEEPTLSPFLDFFWRQLSLMDPVENMVKLDPLGKNVEIHKAANGEQPDWVGIKVTPDPKGFEEIRKALPPQFAGAELKDLFQVYWISRKDLMITRYEVNARVAFFGIKTMDFSVRSTPKDYNKTELNIPQPLKDKMGGKTK